MPKYLIQGNYTKEGIHGLLTDSASGRRADVQTAIKAVGGTVESFYYTLDGDCVMMIVELPDNITAAAVSLNTSATGTVHTRITPLLSVEDIDRALEIRTDYRAPGA